MATNCIVNRCAAFEVFLDQVRPLDYIQRKS